MVLKVKVLEKVLGKLSLMEPSLQLAFMNNYLMIFPRLVRHGNARKKVVPVFIASYFECSLSGIFGNFVERFGGETGKIWHAAITLSYCGRSTIKKLRIVFGRKLDTRSRTSLDRCL